MTTPLLQSRPVATDRPVPPRPTGGLLSWPGWVLGWLWSFVVGAFLCTLLLPSFVVLGWLGRWVRGRVLRGLYLASPRRGEMPLEDACAELGERVPCRPNWFLRDGSEEKPTARTLLGRLLWPVWSLGVNFRLGVKLAVATWLLVGWACLLQFFGWELGWANSFFKGYERAGYGPAFSLAGIFLFALLLPYTLLAQVHVAVTGELKSVLDHRLLRRMIRVSLLPFLGLVLVLFALGAIFEGLKSIGRLGMGHNLGSEPTAAEIRHLHGLMQTFFFWSCVGLVVALLLLKALAARIYRGALVKLLRRGEVRPDDLPPTLRRWATGLRVGSPPSNPTWSTARFLGRAGLRFVLFLGLLVCTVQAYVGVFLAYDPGPASSYLNRPLVQVPWFGFTPDNLEELAKAAEGDAGERP